MRILIIGRCDTTFTLDASGADWSSDYQIALRLARRGFTVSFLSFHGSPIERTAGGVRHINSGGADRKHVVSLIAAETADVIVVSSWKSLIVDLAAVGDTRRKILWMRANQDLDADPAQTRIINQSVERVIAVSHFIGSALIERGYASEKVIVIENGYDEKTFLPHFGSRQSKMFVHAGATTRLKGIPLLVSAFETFHGRYAAAELHVFGSAKLHGKTEEFESSLTKTPGVIWHGDVRQRELAKAFRKADLGFMLTDPSQGVDLFGKSALEMLACGLPVMVSNNGGLPERVDDRVSGFILREYSETALLELMYEYDAFSSERKLEISHAAYNKARELTWSTTVNNFEKLLAS